MTSAAADGIPRQLPEVGDDFYQSSSPWPLHTFIFFITSISDKSAPIKDILIQCVPEKNCNLTRFMIKQLNLNRFKQNLQQNNAE